MAGMDSRIYSSESVPHLRLCSFYFPFTARVSINSLYIALVDLAWNPTYPREAPLSPGNRPVPDPHDPDVRISRRDLFRGSSRKQYRLRLSPHQYGGHIWWTRIVSVSPPYKSAHEYNRLTFGCFQRECVLSDQPGAS